MHLGIYKVYICILKKVYNYYISSVLQTILVIHYKINEWSNLLIQIVCIMDYYSTCFIVWHWWSLSCVFNGNSKHIKQCKEVKTWWTLVVKMGWRFVNSKAVLDLLASLTSEQTAKLTYPCYTILSSSHWAEGDLWIAS